jgi:hypothetical protein
MAIIIQTFPHRLNPDGTFDSICPGCFQTIATQKEESQLAAAEEAHRCPGLDLDRLFYTPDRR